MRWPTSSAKRLQRLRSEVSSSANTYLRPKGDEGTIRGQANRNREERQGSRIYWLAPIRTASKSAHRCRPRGWQAAGGQRPQAGIAWPRQAQEAIVPPRSRNTSNAIIPTSPKHLPWRISVSPRRSKAAFSCGPALDDPLMIPGQNRGRSVGEVIC